MHGGRAYLILNPHQHLSDKQSLDSGGSKGGSKDR